MKIMVTGGAGFIGSNLVDGLISAENQVVVVDNLSSGKRKNVNPKARLYELDIRDPKLEDAFGDEGIDYVFHLAAQIDVRYSVAHPEIDAGINIIGLLNLLENCRRHQVKGVVFSSSGGVVYGEPKRLPATETFPKGPQSPYGVSKLSSEFYFCYYAQVLNLPYIALRYANVYGPRQDPNGEAGVVAIFGLKLIKGETPTIFGDGEQTRDYVYVGDVVRANLLALKKLEERAGSSTGCLSNGCAINDFAYNVGTGVPTSVNQLFAIEKEITGFRGEPVYGPERTGELKQIYLDATKAKNKLGWEPRVDLRTGLKKTVDFLKQQAGVLV